MRYKASVVTLTMLLLLSACTGSAAPTASPIATRTARSQQTGTLEGHVTIGPLVPVLREGEPEPTPAPEVYASREIVIYAQDGQIEITRVQIDPKGDYRVTLPAGTYVVDINRVGIDRGIDLPQTVEIVSQQVTRLDIEIDTGIR